MGLVASIGGPGMKDNERLLQRFNAYEPLRFPARKSVSGRRGFMRPGESPEEGDHLAGHRGGGHIQQRQISGLAPGSGGDLPERPLLA